MVVMYVLLVSSEISPLLQYVNDSDNTPSTIEPVMILGTRDDADCKLVRYDFNLFLLTYRQT